MASGPSITAAVGLNVGSFNDGAAKVISKAQEMGQKIQNAVNGKTATVNLSRSAGLLTDPAAFLNAERARQRASDPANILRAAQLKAEERKAGLATEKAMMAEERAQRAAADKAASKAGQSSGALGGGMKMFAGLMTANFLEGQIRDIVEYGSHVNDLSERLGISAEAVQKWDYALKQTGSDINAASTFFEKLGKSRQAALSGKDDKIAQFQRLGVTLEQLKSMRIEDIAAQIGKAFEAGDPQALIGDLKDIGGKAAGALIPAFSEGITGLFEEAKNSSVIMSDEVVASIDKIGDAWSRTGMTIKSALAPAIAGLVDLIDKGIEWARTAGAFGIGALSGSVEAAGSSISKLLTGDIKGGIVDALSIPSAFANGGVDFVKDFREGTALQKQQESEANAKKAERLRNSSGGFEERESKKSVNERERLEETLRKREARNELESLTDEEDKRTLLVARRAALEKQIADFQSKGQTNDALKSKIELADVNKDLIHLDKEDQKDTAKLLKPHANALQEMGGFLGSFAAAAGPEVAAANATVKSEQHLSRIVRLLEKQQPQLSDSPEDVSYGS